MLAIINEERKEEMNTVADWLKDNKEEWPEFDEIINNIKPINN